MGLSSLTAVIRTIRRFLLVLLAGLLTLSRADSSAAETETDRSRLVVVLYPQNNDGSPGNFLVDQSIRSTLADGSRERIEIYNEYLDVSHPASEEDQQLQRDYLRRKYSGRAVELVIAGLSPALDFALTHRDIFPGAPVVFCAVDYRELQSRNLPPDVAGTPINFDLLATLNLALRLHPDTQHVAVVAGRSQMDAAWEKEARSAFRPYEERLEIVYLSGLAVDDLWRKVASLPQRTIIYYLHVFQDGAGKATVPAHVLEGLAQRANAPIYGHVDSYIGRGIVGGLVFSWEREGRNAARLGLRILAGESPERIGVQELSPNEYMFDGRQLKRWNVPDAKLPHGSTVKFREASFWALYKWRIVGATVFCLVQSLLIVALLVQRFNRKRADQRFQQAVDAAPDGMLVVNRDGRIVLANARMEQLFGYHRAELVGQPVEMLLSEAVRSTHADRRSSFFASSEARSTGVGRELVGRRKDGHEFPVEIGLSPLQSDAGLIVLASVIDTSERRQAEEGLRTSQSQLRQLSGRLIGAQETERRRIARELHDDFSQSLALLSVEMDILHRKLPESARELGPRVEELCARVRQLSSSVHELSHELHPLKLEQLGLVAAIRSLCKELAQSHDLAIEFIADAVPDGISPDTALCLYRVVQESLRNVIKHSGAKDACVTLNGSVNEICLRIVDTGAGFDASSAPVTEGLGLISMRERLRLVGGTIVIDARPARGTQIDVRVPLGPSAPTDLQPTPLVYDGIVDYSTP